MLLKVAYQLINMALKPREVACGERFFEHRFHMLALTFEMLAILLKDLSIMLEDFDILSEVVGGGCFVSEVSDKACVGLLKVRIDGGKRR